MRQIPPPILISNDPAAQQGTITNHNQVQRTVSQPPTAPSPFLTIDSPSSQQTQHISNVSSYSSNVRTTIQNIGPSPSGTIRSPIVRLIKPHQVPGRPISTFSSLASKKQNAAPLPTLPSKLEISEQKNKVEQEIQCLRAELSSLMHQWNFYNEELLSYTMEHDSDTNSNSVANSTIQDTTNDQSIDERTALSEEAANSSSTEMKSSTKSKTKHATVLPTDITKSNIIHGVKEYHNILLSDPLIESVINSNKKKKKESESSVFTSKLTPDAKFRTINDLPLYKTTIQDIKEIVAPIFAAHLESRELIKQKQEGLAKFYVEKFENSKPLQEKVDDYNVRVDSVSENWPSEFPKGKTKPENEEELLKWTAPDQPMFMTETRSVANCYYNTNGFVPDPVAAHVEFKNRISWSDDEKKKFVSKYMQHPKKFRLIADSLPLKSVKDVIEFYYVNRYTLSLKEKETARRKRGGKKKVVSEGSAKTTK